MVIPAGDFGKGVPPKDVTGNAYLQAWYADAELSEDVVYEVVRVAWEHIKDFRLYHHAGKQYSAEGMAALPYPEEEWHPGAVI